jgi:hypothetical protein
VFSRIILYSLTYLSIMCKSNQNLDIPPPRHTPGNLYFDVLVRSNSLHIFVIPVQIHHILGIIGVQIPHMYGLEATAFRNLGITKFFDLSFKNALQSFKAIFLYPTKDKTNGIKVSVYRHPPSCVKFLLFQYFFHYLSNWYRSVSKMAFC